MTSEQIKIVNNIKFSIINAIGNIDSEQMWEMLKQAYEQTEKEPCEDCISREAVIKIFGEVHPMDYNTQAYITNIQNLPSVTPTRPKGKWIQTKDDCDGVNFYDFSFECSKCGKEQSFKSTFCPICGAYMREVKE